MDSVVDACLFIYLLNCKDECFNYIIYSEGSLLDCSFAKLLLYVYMQLLGYKCRFNLHNEWHY